MGGMMYGSLFFQIWPTAWLWPTARLVTELLGEENLHLTFSLLPSYIVNHFQHFSVSQFLILVFLSHLSPFNHIVTDFGRFIKILPLRFVFNVICIFSSSTVIWVLIGSLLLSSFQWVFIYYKFFLFY